MMKNLLLFTIFLTTTFYKVQGQTQKDSICCKAYFERIKQLKKEAQQTQSAQPFDDFLNSNPKLPETLLANVYIQEAKVLTEIYSDEFNKLKNTDKKYLQNRRQILDCYDNAIKVDSSNTLKYVNIRFNFLDAINEKSTLLYKNDLETLKNAGYKPDKKGFQLAIMMNKGNGVWLGVEVSPITLNRPRYKLVDAGKVIYRNIMDFSMVFVPISFSYNLDNKGKELAFSLFEANISPIKINFTKFGFQNNGLTNRVTFFYRPEIGVSWAGCSIYYGRNFVIEEKAYRGDFGKHYFGIKYGYCFGKPQTN